MVICQSANQLKTPAKFSWAFKMVSQFGRKRCTTNRENRSLMRIVKQNRFNNLGELHKEWTEAGVKASRATTHRGVKEFGYSCRQRCLTWAKEKKNWTVAQWSKAIFSDESKFCISFGNLASALLGYAQEEQYMFEGEDVETEPSQSSCPAYEELLEVMEHTTVKLDLSWEWTKMGHRGVSMTGTFLAITPQLKWAFHFFLISIRRLRRNGKTVFLSHS